jgi:peptidoglycan lytic transglycosylase
MRLALPIRIVQLGAAAAVAVVLCGCASGPRSRTAAAADSRAISRQSDGPGADIPADLASRPDAEPRIEPIRPGGANKPYQVLGREYVPLARDVPFSERGLASWYGRKFQGRMTSSGEPYDMYAMTAAHPTLPIPSYARIRNPANGREVVVRVNDRGPFVSGRIVDLSYAAALKLDLLRGVAPVELERITFDDIRTGAWRGGAPIVAGAATLPSVVVPQDSVVLVAAAPPPAPPTAAPLVASSEAVPATPRAIAEAARGFWIQLGAFRERDGAERFRRRVAADSESSWLEPLLAIFGDAPLYRVQAGPYPSRGEADDAAQRARAALGLVPVVIERR